MKLRDLLEAKGEFKVEYETMKGGPVFDEMLPTFIKAESRDRALKEAEKAASSYNRFKSEYENKVRVKQVWNIV